MQEFKGIQFRIAENWLPVLPTDGLPKTYLEVGTLCGINAIYFERLFGMHPDTKIYCIDPWDLLDDPKYGYKEAYNQKQNYSDYLENIQASGKASKFTTIKGFSYEEIPKFAENFFDIIYIDANHGTEDVLEDTILSFRKLKQGGYMIFDDYQCPETRLGIDVFRFAFKNKIKEIGMHNCQFFIQKL